MQLHCLFIWIMSNEWPLVSVYFIWLVLLLLQLPHVQQKYFQLYRCTQFSNWKTSKNSILCHDPLLVGAPFLRFSLPSCKMTWSLKKTLNCCCYYYCWAVLFPEFNFMKQETSCESCEQLKRLLYLVCRWKKEFYRADTVIISDTNSITLCYIFNRSRVKCSVHLILWFAD